MAALAWPYKLSQTPSFFNSKNDCSIDLPKQVPKHQTFSVANHVCECETVKGHVRRGKSETMAKFPISRTNPYRYQTSTLDSMPLFATLNSPRGFGRSPKKTKKKNKKSKTGNDSEDEDEDEDEEEEESEEGVIPEIVTNRMISRMGFSVGIPLVIGLLFFPFFYYLKVVLKIDVPTWVPFIVSFFFFGTALLGVSYGIVSSSWDPLREGSLLGWNEAQKNWPVFWQSLWGGGSGKK